jgi:hypothetical protein
MGLVYLGRIAHSLEMVQVVANSVRTLLMALQPGQMHNELENEGWKLEHSETLSHT